ncbi:CCA tRNA nucleotidyltransferase [Patescibacteria group bacterium]
MLKTKKIELPKEITEIIDKFKKNNFEAYAVGGCVRDILLSKEPKDWDITTNAKPEQIQKIFPDNFYKNNFGTVTIKVKNFVSRTTIKEIEITTFRSEEGYSDKRHPDKITFATTLKEDLSRRDFTINAMAINNNCKIIDPFKGQNDLAKKIIKTAGNPEERFNEDALRMLRAVRFATELNFEIEKNTFKAIQKNSGWLQAIAKERIRDEFIKIIMADKPDKGIELLKQSNLLKYIVPELEKGIGVGQNKHHIYTIYEHCVLSLKFAAEKKFNLDVRLSALLHDIAKPQTKRGKGYDSTFYNHDIVGAKFAANILQRLKFPKKTIKRIVLLIRNHMFVYAVEEVSEAGVRRILRRVGLENIPDLLNLRVADRLGSGVPKAVPYKLRHLQYIIEKVSKDPISVKMLKINGDNLMKLLKIKPNPKIGLILNSLLAKILENPKLNTKKDLEKLAKELNKLSEIELKANLKKVKQAQEKADMKMKKKYWVQ